jgi:hypothetical protein
MKVIYMEQTLNLMAQTNLEEVKNIVSTGVVKQKEFGTYLVIETKSEELI